jgi:hypothetical protein
LAAAFEERSTFGLAESTCFKAEVNAWFSFGDEDRVVFTGSNLALAFVSQQF